MRANAENGVDDGDHDGRAQQLRHPIHAPAVFRRLAHAKSIGAIVEEVQELKQMALQATRAAQLLLSLPVTATAPSAGRYSIMAILELSPGRDPARRTRVYPPGRVAKRCARMLKSFSTTTGSCTYASARRRLLKSPYTVQHGNENYYRMLNLD